MNLKNPDINSVVWHVYVLLCADGSLYTGSTNNLEKRFADHQSGKGGKYTRSHKPLKLIYSEESESRSTALKREIVIKSWSRLQKIQVLKLQVNVQLLDALLRCGLWIKEGGIGNF